MKKVLGFALVAMMMLVASCSRTACDSQNDTTEITDSTVDITNTAVDTLEVE